MKKNIIFIFVFLLVFLSQKSIVNAFDIPGSDEDCPNSNPQDCVNTYGGTVSEWRCSSKICIPTNSAVGSFQDNLKRTEASNSIDDGYWTARMIGNIFSSVTTVASGDTSIDTALGPSSTSPTANLRSKGMIGIIADLNYGLYTYPPVSSVEYFADLGKNFGIAHPVYAQGPGFNGLSNMLPLWKASKNLAYIMLIVMFIYIGFAVMLRVKISPQAVVSIQNALPSLVIALILVTFSYAIVGLVLDSINLIINIGVITIAQTGKLDNVLGEQYKYTHLHFSEIWGILVGGGFRTVTKTITDAYFSNINWTSLVTIPRAITGIFAWLAGSGFALLFTLASLFLVIKLFFALLNAYIAIIISVITGPLQIVFGVLPGSKGGFNAWFKNLVANALIFPAVSLTLLIAWLLTYLPAGMSPNWVPPTLFWSGGTGGQALTPLLGFGMLLLISKVPEMVKTAMGYKPSGYGKAIGEALGVYQGAYKTGATAVVSKLEEEERFIPAAVLSTLAGIRGSGGRKKSSAPVA